MLQRHEYYDITIPPEIVLLIGLRNTGAIFFPPELADLYCSLAKRGKTIIMIVPILA